MSERQRVCAFYSKGNHFLAMLQALRRQHPDAAVTAMVPPGYAISPDARNLVDDLVETEQIRYRLREFSAVRRLLGQLRSQRFDVFAVMFDSPRLRMLAALSHARKRLCYTAAGQCVEMDASAPRVVVKDVLRLLRGHLVYAGLWLTVRLFMTRPKLQLRRIARKRK